jgi:hypothetical protein
MPHYRTEFHHDEFIYNILAHYRNIMYLKIFVDDPDYELKTIYQEAATNHNDKIENDSQFIDAGFDLYLPTNYN